PAIKTLVARYREQEPKVTYLELVQFARAEGDALRARSPGTRSKAAKTLLLESNSSSPSFATDGIPKQGYDNINVIHHDGLSIPTTELPSTTDGSVDSTARDTENGQVFYLNDRRTPAPRTPYSNGMTRIQRPGWVGNGEPGRYTDARNAVPRNAGVTLVCHLCFERGHTSPQCLLSLRDMARVVDNYEALSTQEKVSVPLTSYLRAKTDFPNALAHTPNSRYKPAQPARAAPAPNHAGGSPPAPAVATVQRNHALVAEEVGPSPDQDPVQGKE
ncbi:unnamed protein product, partial [Agarophyton chilense]